MVETCTDEGDPPEFVVSLLLVDDVVAPWWD